MISYHPQFMHHHSRSGSRMKLMAGISSFVDILSRAKQLALGVCLEKDK